MSKPPRPSDGWPKYWVPPSALYLGRHAAARYGNNLENKPLKDWTIEEVLRVALMSMENKMNFSEALNVLKRNEKVTRRGWNGKNMYIALQVPDAQPSPEARAGAKMTLPYIYMKTADGNLVPWLASQTDLMSDDWEFFVG